LSGIRRGSSLTRVSALLGSAAVVIVSQIYFSQVLTPYNHDFSTIIFGVFVPLILGCALLSLTRQWVAMLAYVGFLFAVVDDVPVLFDWPRLTGFPPGVSHADMQVYLYILSLAFLMSSISLSLAKSHPSKRAILLSYLLTLFAFFSSYFDDVPLEIVKTYVTKAWYQLDIVEHLVALSIFALALLVSRGKLRLLLTGTDPGSDVSDKI